MSNTDFAVAIEDLTVSFDGFKAIDSLTLYIDKNELRVIIGPNGAGKTTLLDLICGKTKASSGSISHQFFFPFPCIFLRLPDLFAHCGLSPPRLIDLFVTGGSHGQLFGLPA